jgi:hypothetical protein
VFKILTNRTLVVRLLRVGVFFVNKDTQGLTEMVLGRGEMVLSVTETVGGAISRVEGATFNIKGRGEK